MSDPWWGVATILFSGVIAAIVSAVISSMFEKKRTKLILLSDLLGNRIALTEHGSDHERALFFNALNRIVLVFHKNPQVIAMLKKFKNQPGQDQVNFERLLHAICDDLGLNELKDEDELLNYPFRSKFGGKDKT